MTRRRALTDDQLRAARAMHQPGKVGYETIGKRLGVGASTVRDALKYYTAYSARVV